MSILLFFFSFSADRADFSIKFRDNVCPFGIIGVFAVPGEEISLEIVKNPKGSIFTVRSKNCKILKIDSTRWKIKVPQEKGLYPLCISNNKDSVKMNILVVVPLKELKDGYLNNYRIGKYPGPFKSGGKVLTMPPIGFIEVTKENENTLISPHFTLKQFLCKQASRYPKYLVLREKIILKLEHVLEAVNKEGYKCETFNVMSGYRTPYYNTSIGNVQFSRHIFGDAADIFIDENPKDGFMDDLNKDGNIDFHDAIILYKIVDSMYGKPWYHAFTGGLAGYKKTDSHSPFIHIDSRGYRSRWGIAQTELKPRT
jgi:hypothetical protein